jgi:hypothetical protein
VTRSLFCLLLALAATRPATAGPQECREAAEAYKTAHRALLEALHSYGRCVAQSDGRDDCSAEFSNVRSAQDDFEQAVEDYGNECR